MEQIYYSSTRGSGSRVLSSEAILKGIAEDGGLFVPHRIPYMRSLLETFMDMDYRQLAYAVMSRFFTDFTEDELRICIENAYDKKFDTEEVAPVRKVGNLFFMELYHGPTLAFKDMALSILPYLMKTAAKKQGVDKEIVILTATSGDTGKAALEGFSDVEGTKIIVFFPQDGVSEIQKRQMTTHSGDNTFVIGVKGNFDDAQSGVKNIFADREFQALLNEKGYMFSSANSINIGRLVPQIAYYFHAYMEICRRGEVSLGEKINVVVPTGNFGNILAAYYAKEMGLPLNKLICASNDNKVLYDFITTGTYDRNRKFYTTISPSMDILISSNLERLLYVISGGNSGEVRRLMDLLSKVGSYDIAPKMKECLSSFYGGFATDSDTKMAIKEAYNSYRYLMDTHTAVAYHVYKKYLEDTGDTTRSVVVSTASPYKFTSDVMAAIDEKYSNVNVFELVKEMSNVTGSDIPLAIRDIEKKHILHKAICQKDDMKQKIAEILGV